VLGAEWAQPKLPAAAVIGAHAPKCRYDGSHLPHHAGGLLREGGAELTERGERSINILPFAGSGLGPTSGAATWIVHRCAARRAPGIESGPVAVGGAGEGLVGTDAVARAVAVEGPVQWIVVRREALALAASVLAVRIRPAFAVLAPITDSAAERATDGHPQAGLADVAGVAAVHARARLSHLWAKLILPDVWAPVAMLPARVVAIYSVAGFGVDQVRVGRRGGNDGGQDGELHCRTLGLGSGLTPSRAANPTGYGVRYPAVRRMPAHCSTLFPTLGFCLFPSHVVGNSLAKSSEESQSAGELKIFWTLIAWSGYPVQIGGVRSPDTEWRPRS
jgi:hypothetical protein